MNESEIMTTASYGTWISPITAEIVAEGSLSILDLRIDGDVTYWCEMRPKNKGRYTIVSLDKNGIKKDLTPLDFNARTFVHEYGGGSYTVYNGIIYSSCAADHAIYKIYPGTQPQKLTEGQTKQGESGNTDLFGTRFADLHHTIYGLIAIGEEHHPDKSVNNFLGLINTTTGTFEKIASGYDFYSSPAISKDEKKIAWVSWNHPNMPWSVSELWVGDLESPGIIKNAQCITRKNSESVLQPRWDDHNTLYFITDRDNGWWNIHKYSNGKIENICPMEAEVGEPLWVFGKSTYAFLGEKIVFAYNRNSIWDLGILNRKTKEWQNIRRDAIVISQLHSGNHCVRFIENYADKGPSIMQMDDKSDLPCQTLFSDTSPFNKGYISIGQQITFPSDGRVSHGIFYQPKNVDFKGPSSELPPLIIMIHGGPTSQAFGQFQLKHQYWTSLGYAVLDINHGGSSGYGRRYRELLDLSWGIVDVEDCANGALYLANQKLVDRNKCVIRGGSAGGYTTLAALAFTKTFKAGASYYGVADLTALASDTHKFEKFYMDSLIGKYPETKSVWEERSPINSIEKIEAPLIVFQGEDDLIVLPNQSTMIFEALTKRGVPCILHTYPGEQHGFRQAKTIIHSLKEEATFYRNVLIKKD